MKKLFKVFIFWTKKHLVNINEQGILNYIFIVFYVVMLCFNLPIINLIIRIFGLPYNIYDMFIELSPKILPLNLYLIYCVIYALQRHTKAIGIRCSPKICLRITRIRIVIEIKFIYSYFNMIYQPFSYERDIFIHFKNCLNRD